MERSCKRDVTLEVPPFLGTRDTYADSAAVFSVRPRWRRSLTVIHVAGQGKELLGGQSSLFSSFSSVFSPFSSVFSPVTSIDERGKKATHLDLTPSGACRGVSLVVGKKVVSIKASS